MPYLETFDNETLWVCEDCEFSDHDNCEDDECECPYCYGGEMLVD
jgi:hypothetical protein